MFKMDFIQLLPTELLENIFKNLTVQDLISCSLVSKGWRSLTNIDFIWRSHCKERGFLSKTVGKEDQSYKDKIIGQENLLDLIPLCKWRKVFSWHNRLRNNWLEQNYSRHSLSTEKCDASVFCLDSDGLIVVSGHEDASVNVWKVSNELYHVNRFFGTLRSEPVASVTVWEDYIVLLQRRLLQIFKKKNWGYELQDTKTFELGSDIMSVWDKISILGDTFDNWYKECLRVNENGHSRCVGLLYRVTRGLLLTAVCGSGELWVWRLDGKPRASLGGFRSIKSIQVFGRKAYIISGQTETVLSTYSFKRNETKQVLRVPGIKEIHVSEEFLIAVPNRIDPTIKMLWVWDKQYRLVRKRRISVGHVSVAAVRGLVLFSEESLVTVWDPKRDAIINSFSVGMTIGFIKPAFSTFLLVFVNASVHVWDFVAEKNLYRIYSELEWNGDFRDQLRLSPTMIIAVGVDKQMERLSFNDYCV